MLNGKTALVTGGARGIGRAICVALAGQGANIVINYAGNEAAAQETKTLCEAAGGKAVTVRADVGNFAECEALFARAESTFGAPEILVNNAGITKDTLLLRMAPEAFEEVLRVNLLGAFHCTKLAARTMVKKRAGRIVNIASVVGLHGNAGQANYAASKAGLIGLTKSAAKELARRGITVNAVAPGFIQTDMTASLPQEIKDEMLREIPLQCFGEAEDVAKLVAFLCGDGGYITGQVLCVDGGMSM